MSSANPPRPGDNGSVGMALLTAPPFPYVAEIRFHGVQVNDAERSLGELRVFLQDDPQTRALAEKAFISVGFPVTNHAPIAQILSVSGGYARLLIRDGVDLVLYCCSTFPRCPPDELLAQAAKYAAGVSRSLGKAWKNWSVVAIHAIQGTHLPWQAKPPEHWLTSGKEKSPLVELAVLLVSVLLALYFDSRQGTKLLHGALLASATSVVRILVVALMGRKERRRGFRMTAKDSAI